MAIANYFYHGVTKKHVAIFGSIFNKLSVVRRNSDGTEEQRIVVPIGYGPFEKFLARNVQDPNLDRKVSMSLPRIAFEIVGLTYEGERKTGSLKKLKLGATDNNEGSSMMYVPATYNYEFNLYIMSKFQEDGLQLIEQILPFFKPEFTVSAVIVEGAPVTDIPIILNSVTSEDTYDSDFETRRAIIWTLSFTMKASIYGPEKRRKVIKFVDVRTHNSVNSNAPVETQITHQPGLTEEGLPTGNPQLSIPFADIQEDDDWQLITIIEDFEE